MQPNFMYNETTNIIQEGDKVSNIIVAMILDFFIGDPMPWPHPVIYIGNYIKFLEKKLYPMKNKKLAGLILVLINLLTISIIIIGMHRLLAFSRGLTILFDLYLLYAGIAYRALIKASKSVSDELKINSLREARKKISMFVSRDTGELTKEQVMKTTIETVSENTIDGVIAPLFFAIIGELLFKQPVLFIWLYKGINTMDSMIAYMNERYKDFGFFAAKLDDVANYVPARIGSLIILLTGIPLRLNLKRGFNTYIRDRHNSKSPNAAHPESMVAGLLGIQLGGTYSYFGQATHKQTIGDSVEEVKLEHVIKTEHILTVCYVYIFIMLAIMVICK